MAGENRTPEKKIGEVKHAEEQAARTTGHLPPHGAGSTEGKETPKPDKDSAKK